MMTRSAPNRLSGAAEALDYEAPFVIEKLVKDHFADTAAEARALFAEVKRYLVLTEVDRTKTWKMHSVRVDEAWHQFVLFTVAYSDFCTKYFGRYRHHSPRNAPPTELKSAPEATLAEFAARYRDIFGIDLPQVWDDSSSVALHRRVLNYRCGRFALISRDGMVDLMYRGPRPLFSVSDIAQEALRFIVDTGAFYVRELPGELTDDEKVALVSALVSIGVLRVG
jgi:hypothetical protein